MDYVIITDSCANLPNRVIDELELTIIPMVYLVGDKEFISYQKEKDADLKAFYNMLRDKEVVTTSCISPDTCRKTFEPLLKEGKDIFYIGFSSGLSSSYQVAETVAEDLREEYPDRKIITIDSLCASLGQGLLVAHAAKKRLAGESLQEVYDWTKENVLHLCHWFTVDDLMFLKRGGRVSGATALLGTMMGIKPVLHVDNEGHLINVSKARGRKASLDALVDKMEATAIDPKDQMIYISHGDSIEDAEYVKSEIIRRMGSSDFLINYIDPVIGAHSGPGTIALFFLGTHR